MMIDNILEYNVISITKSYGIHLPTNLPVGRVED